MSAAMSPWEFKRGMLRPDGAARYNDAAGQRARIIGRLHLGPATRQQIEHECYAPCPTKRLSELRRLGWRISGTWGTATAPDGSVFAAVVYALDSDPADAAQMSLPLDG